MRGEGASFPEIGRALGVAPRTVRGWAEVDGWEGPEEVASAEPAAGKPAGRVRAARLKDRERAFNETWSLVLQQLAVVLALPGETAGEMTRFEREMRRLMLLVGLLTKLAPLLKRATPPHPPKEVRPDVSDQADLGALLEEVARRFDGFQAAEPAAGLLESAQPGRTPGFS